MHFSTESYTKYCIWDEEKECAELCRLLMPSNFVYRLIFCPYLDSHLLVQLWTVLLQFCSSRKSKNTAFVPVTPHSNRWLVYWWGFCCVGLLERFWRTVLFSFLLTKKVANTVISNLTIGLCGNISSASPFRGRLPILIVPISKAAPHHGEERCSARLAWNEKIYVSFWLLKYWYRWILWGECVNAQHFGHPS